MNIEKVKDWFKKEYGAAHMITIIGLGDTESVFAIMEEYAQEQVKNLTTHVVSGSEYSSIRAYKLECLTEDGDIETNGYYKTREKAELMKAEMDKYKGNLKYGIKQHIVAIDIED